MADHLRKTTQKQTDDIPLLASAYVRFDPVPKGWENMVKDFNKWKKDNPESSDYNHPNLSIIAGAAEILTKNIGEEVKADADYRTYLRDGSLILEIFITIPLIDLITNDVKLLIEAAAKNENLTPWDASVIVGKLIAEMVVLERQMKKITIALLEIVKAVVGRDYAVRPESRIGVFGNILRFHEHFSSAKISGHSIANRAESMKKATKQLKIIQEVLQREADRKIIYTYLLIRTRDLKHLKPGKGKPSDYKNYNKCVDDILAIQQELQHMGF